MGDLKHYKRGDQIHVRAQQQWMILTGMASFGQRPNTYLKLSLMMGYPSPAPTCTIKPLAIIAKYCQDHGLPQLNVLVVNSVTNKPGHGVILKPGQTVAEAQKEVYDFDWHSIRPPPPAVFRRVWENWE